MAWKRSDVEDGVRYCVGLYVNDKGWRDYVLIDEDSGSIVGGTPNTPILAETQSIENIDLLKRRDYEAMSENVKLKDGRHFWVDAHGVWYVEGVSLDGVKLPPK